MRATDDQRHGPRSAGRTAEAQLKDQRPKILKKTMGCAASKAAAASPPPTAESVPKPIAFEIPVVEAEAIKEKKLPPTLQQRLEEQNNQNNLTVEELREKMQKAEERRLTILEEKKSVARQAQKMFSKGDSTPNGDKQADGGEEVTEGS